MRAGGSYRIVDGDKYRLDRQTGEWELIESAPVEETPEETPTPEENEED
jgi:hypothetical protein